MIAERIPELQNFTARPDAFPPRQDHIQLLEERLAQHRLHPDDVIPWEEVKRRLNSGQ